MVRTDQLHQIHCLTVRTILKEEQETEGLKLNSILIIKLSEKTTQIMNWMLSLKSNKILTNISNYCKI